MASHGQPWPAMASLGRPWPAMTKPGHGQPWQALAGHDQTGIKYTFQVSGTSFIQGVRTQIAAIRLEPGHQSLFILAPFNESYFVLRMEYKQGRFLETSQVQAYPMNSLVGNIGGYIGMFLGYALLNVPGTFMEFLQKFILKRSK